MLSRAYRVVLSVTKQLRSPGPAPSEVSRFELIGHRWTVGRSRTAEICVRRGNISGEHMYLAVIDGRLTISDSGETNGTYVNGQKIGREHLLHVGDRFYASDFVVKLEQTPVEVTACEVSYGCWIDGATASDIILLKGPGTPKTRS